VFIEARPSSGVDVVQLDGQSMMHRIDTAREQKMNQNIRFHTWITAVCLALGTSVSEAAVVYGVGLDSGNIQAGGTSSTASAGVRNEGGSVSRTFFQVDASGNFSYESASASAGRFGLRSSSNAVINMLDANNVDTRYVSSLHNIDSAAGMTLDDFIISGPGSGTVLGSLNLDLQGGVNANTFLQNGERARANGSVSVFGTLVNNSNSFSGSMSQTSTNGSVAGSQLGILSGYDNSAGMITTPEFLLPINTPFTLTLQLQTSASASADGRSGDSLLPKVRLATGAGTFNNTLTFAIGGQVFNLPAGYTINSASAGIVDNQYVIPLPAAVWLFASGILGLIGIARRKLH
jgi:hypothetical protein